MAIAAALALRGNGAPLNFPKLAHSLPRLVDLTDKSIQAAATMAANNFAQRTTSGDTPCYNTTTTSSSRNSPATGTSSQSRIPSKSSKSSALAHSKSFPRTSRRNTVSSSEERHGDHINRLSYNVIDSSGRESSTVENSQQHQAMGVEPQRENLAAGFPHPQPMYIDSEDMFTIGPVGLNNLCDAMCIPPPDPLDHAAETDGEEGSNSTWEPHLWSY